MVAIPGQNEQTKNAIEGQLVTQVPRPYLGMSQIGHECNRYLWYAFRWVFAPQQNTARQMRIFERGDMEEARIIRDLKAVGIEVYRPDPDTGKHIELFGTIGEEQEEIIGFAGHAKGHTDGRALGVLEAPKTEHLLEFKTANAKNFKKYPLDGVEATNPVYYGQVQRYMAGKDLKRTLFVVTNKDTEERHYERIRFDKEKAGRFIEKEQSIILSDCPPDKEFSPTWFKCKWCNARDICHGGSAVERNCRTCARVDMHNDGIWECDMAVGVHLSVDKQRVGCELYKPLI